ncbi:MAG: helix-turn-helix domain-containing protein [Clostridiales bacterium]|nr:helix-turn-helix domain-containing protein [Clostridiales bacterium]
MEIKDYIKEYIKAGDPRSYRVFGRFLRERRQEAGKTLCSFADDLNISPTYLSDIEKGNRPVPDRLIDQLKGMLVISKEEEPYFYDLAYSSRCNHPDINEYLERTPSARMFLRLAMRKNLSDEEFMQYFNKMVAEKEKKEKDRSL